MSRETKERRLAAFREGWAEGHAYGLEEAARYLLARANRARFPNRGDYDKSATYALREASAHVKKLAAGLRTQQNPEGGR